MSVIRKLFSGRASLRAEAPPRPPPRSPQSQTCALLYQGYPRGAVPAAAPLGSAECDPRAAPGACRRLGVNWDSWQSKLFGLQLLYASIARENSAGVSAERWRRVLLARGAGRAPAPAAGRLRPVTAQALSEKLRREALSRLTRVVRTRSDGDADAARPSGQPAASSSRTLAGARAGPRRHTTYSPFVGQATPAASQKNPKVSGASNAASQRRQLATGRTQHQSEASLQQAARKANLHKNSVLYQAQKTPRDRRDSSVQQAERPVPERQLAGGQAARVPRPGPAQSGATRRPAWDGNFAGCESQDPPEVGREGCGGQSRCRRTPGMGGPLRQ